MRVSESIGSAAARDLRGPKVSAAKCARKLYRTVAPRLIGKLGKVRDYNIKTHTRNRIASSSPRSARQTFIAYIVDRYYDIILLSVSSIAATSILCLAPRCDYTTRRVACNRAEAIIIMSIHFKTPVNNFIQMNRVSRHSKAECLVSSVGYTAF